jgi:hypothetical protein
MFTSDQTMKSLGDPTSTGIKNFEDPFVVFCTLCVIVDFLVCLLRQETIYQNANPEAIHGVWSQLKDTSPFCVEFGETPSAASTDIYEIFCTYVIGAGFSIDERFEAFHAFSICC